MCLCQFHVSVFSRTLRSHPTSFIWLTYNHLCLIPSSTGCERHGHVIRLTYTLGPYLTVHLTNVHVYSLVTFICQIYRASMARSFVVASKAPARPIPSSARRACTHLLLVHLVHLVRLVHLCLHLLLQQHPQPYPLPRRQR